MAKNTVTLFSGFHAKAGGSFHALITPYYTGCNEINTYYNRVGSPGIDSTSSLPYASVNKKDMFLKGTDKKVNNDHVTENKAELLVYPVPNEGVFNVLSKSDYKIDKIEVFNSIGKRVYLETNSSLNNFVNITNQPKGLYLLRVYINNSSRTYPIVCK